MFKNKIILLYIILFFISFHAYSNNNSFVELCYNNIISKINGTVKRISKNNNNLSSIEIEKDDGSHN